MYIIKLYTNRYFWQILHSKISCIYKLEWNIPISGDCYYFWMLFFWCLLCVSMDALQDCIHRSFSWHLQQQRPFRITDGCSDYGSEYTAEYNHRLLLRMSSIIQKTKPRRHYFFNSIVTLLLCIIYVCKIR